MIHLNMCMSLLVFDLFCSFLLHVPNNPETDEMQRKKIVILYVKRHVGVIQADSSSHTVLAAV